MRAEKIGFFHQSHDRDERGVILPRAEELLISIFSGSGSDAVVEFDADRPVFADVLQYSDPPHGSVFGSVVGHPHDPFADGQRR